MESLKSLGSLSPDQLRRLLALHNAVHGMAKELPAIVDSPRMRRLLNRPGVLFQWSWAYEATFAEMLALGFCVIGQGGIVSSAATTEDPQESIISQAESYDPGFHRPKASQLLQAIAYMVANYHSLRAIELYAVSLNRLVADGRRGDDEAFLKAVKVDPTCTSAPSFSKRLSIASMRGERKFIRRIHKAAMDGPNKNLQVFRQLRYSAVVLQESGAFRAGNREHIYQVLAEEMGLYEQTKGDPYKSLFRNLDLWRKFATT